MIVSLDFQFTRIKNHLREIFRSVCEGIFRQINTVGIVIIKTTVLDRNMGRQMYLGSWFQSPRHGGADELELVV